MCYVLETGGLADTLALERACDKHGLPSPTGSLQLGNSRESHRIVVLRRTTGLWFRGPAKTGSMRLKRLVEECSASKQELLLIPVAIYWGRSPDKQQSLFKLLFAENWNVMGRTRKFFATLLHGRSTLLRYSQPLPLSSIIQEGHDPEVAYRKVSRILRVHFRQRRDSHGGTGPVESRRCCQPGAA